MNKKEIEEIEAFLLKKRISGIINIPSLGTVGLFLSHSDKLLVLDYAKSEMLLEKYKRMNVALNSLQQESNKIEYGKIKNKGYVNYCG